MDISNLSFKDSPAQDLQLVHPIDGTDLKDEKGKPITISLLGADSNEFRKAVRTFGNKKLNQKQTKKQSMEELEQTSYRLLAIVTVGWSGILVDGELLKCTRESAEWLYTEYPWIREQVDEFVNDRSNFLASA